VLTGRFRRMRLTPEEAPPGGAYHQQCVQELQQPYPDYAKIQALATLSLGEALREVARQVAKVGHQITSRESSAQSSGARTLTAPEGESSSLS
jgi:hypothetical protein